MALTKVSGNLIADNAVGLSQLAGGTDGNLITFDASGNPEETIDVEFRFKVDQGIREVIAADGSG